MPNLLENLLVHALSGGMRGGLEGLLTQKELEEKALAETMGRGEGVVSVNDLAALMRGGWTGRPDVDFQLSPYGEFNPMEHRTKGYAYMESPQTKARREQVEGYQQKLNKMPGYQFYTYLRDIEKRDQSEAENLTKSIFEMEELPWIKKKVEEPTFEGELKGQKKVLWDMFKRGEFNAQNYKQKLSPFAQRQVEEMKLFPEAEKPPAPEKLSEGEKTDWAIAQARKGLLKDPSLRVRVERAGFDPDTGEPKEKEGEVYSPEIKAKRKEAEAIINLIMNKDVDEISESDTLLLEAVQSYLDSTTKKYGSSAFMGGQVTGKTQSVEDTTDVELLKKLDELEKRLNQFKSK